MDMDAVVGSTPAAEMTPRRCAPPSGRSGRAMVAPDRSGPSVEAPGVGAAGATRARPERPEGGAQRLG
ncbi:hypothetical protein, partial [Streptomyces scabiei]|uniref:hypothetical protein n=1 Tax=Streptomyces scabiei TaxID=1930 RepID=UPI0029B4D698